ncbi:hypothetical protein [Mobilicoccus caccae]|uniref:DhnA family fructose-bisphosphate aldolase class Ia n=1 Tax=Mobilicoccus caccae TaxID=1859295 RepID=A0ABQ6IKG2_9MICO|nr:hypothetical protein [Mobilicoccus caccae]GMA38379.1 hypothetical protein GCM10025883_04240 [Mobilicoccus caccae]
MQAQGTRSLDRKLTAILAGGYSPRDFVIADAKDADMSTGLCSAGPRRDAGGAVVGYRSRADFLQDMVDQIEQGDIDILLASASNAERLADEDRLGHEVTLAVRANDTTDIWANRGATYQQFPSRPFRTASLPRVRRFCDLVLYSMTFTNDIERDLATLTDYREFRAEAADLGVRHFLEVFNPAVPTGVNAAMLPAYVNDSIVRALAGVTQEERPIFLKIAYNGASALSELAQYDPALVVGVLGGSAGTTRDTFELLHRTEKAGGRVALFGRKIQNAESQSDLVRLMRRVVEGDLAPEGAVEAYHSALTDKGLTPQRPLSQDSRLTDPVLLAE